MAHFVVLYGGQLHRGRLNRDTVDRCETALRAAARHDDSVIIYCVDSRIPHLKEVTLAWLSENDWPPDRLILNSRAHESLEETIAAIEVLNARGAEEVTVVTSWYHMRRVLFLWERLWDGRCYPVRAHLATNIVRSLSWELLGFGKLFSRMIFGRVSLSRVRRIH